MCVLRNIVTFVWTIDNINHLLILLTKFRVDANITSKVYKSRFGLQAAACKPYPFEELDEDNKIGNISGATALAFP